MSSFEEISSLRFAERWSLQNPGLPITGPGKNDGFFVDAPATGDLDTDPVTQEPLATPVKRIYSPKPTQINSEIIPAVPDPPAGALPNPVDGVGFTTGKLYPDKVEEGAAGDGSWSGLHRVRAEDGSVATCITGGSGPATEILVSQFPLNIPEGATVVGIQVTVERSLL
jgi:hypothetical protein